MKKCQKIRKALILISFLLFPAIFFYLSPYLIIYGASKQIVSGSFIVFTGLFLVSLILGRGFCGWVCPAGGLQEACFAVQSRKVTRGYWVKFLIWVPWLMIIGITAVRAGGFRKIDPFFQTVHGLSISGLESWIIYYFVLLLITFLALKVGKRSFCHHVCWMAPFMIVGTAIKEICKWPSLRLEADAGKCIHCRKCNQECPMSLDVEQTAGKSMVHSECILCGACVDACPKNVIRFVFAKPTGKPANQNPKSLRSI